MSKQSGLHQRAYSSLKLLDEQRYQARASRLFTQEPSLAVLLLWCNIEVLLRLHKYHHKIQDGWPDKLVFIRANWGPLKHIKGLDVDAYNAIFVGQKSLWKQRDVIAHTGKYISEDEVNHFVKHANFVINILSSNLPTREDFLSKKRRSDAQKNRKKK
ncbi:hypothetical protein [Vibrio sp. 1978]|uniref:hypothetical protein n=1 Tax=Vibrio sp. 1978 TaxID=3074585 RepID=UPI002965F79A|nr:hypothetical protein [Vibrio sp. 1978]MDW3057868.1 hypothetical protein [Vibrio sp. 1978]